MFDSRSLRFIYLSARRPDVALGRLQLISDLEKDIQEGKGSKVAVQFSNSYIEDIIRYILKAFDQVIAYAVDTVSNSSWSILEILNSSTNSL